MSDPAAQNNGETTELELDPVDLPEDLEGDSGNSAEHNGSGAGTGGVTGKGFMPGQSGNPAGRPRGLAAAVRETLRIAVQEGEDPAFAMARFYAGIYADKTQKLEHRMKAAEWLSERGWGKAPAYALIEDGDPLDLTDAATTEIAAEFDADLDELAERRAAREDAGS